MIRVTMLVRNTVYNDNRVLKEAAALAQAGYDVTLVGMQDPSLPDEEMYGGAKIIRVPANGTTRNRLREGMERRAELLAVLRQAALVHTVANKANRVLFRLMNRLSWRLEPFTYMFDFDRGVASREADLKADIWYAHDLNTLPTALRLRSQYGGKVVYDSHEYWLDCNNTYTAFAKTVWAVLERVLIQEADQVITVSQSIAKQLSEDYGIAEPVVVLNTPPYQPGMPYPTLRERYPIAQPFIMVYVGLVTHQRGYEQIISVLPQLPDVALVCFGHGNAAYMDGLKKLAVEHGVADRVLFVGSVPPNEIQSAISGADAGIVAVQRGALSYDFALPSKLFEYIFAGLPVIAGDLVEIRKLVEGYELGTLVDERNPQSIAAGIRRLQADRAKYAGAEWDKRRTQFIERFDWNRHQEVLVELMDQLSGWHPDRPKRDVPA